VIYFRFWPVVAVARPIPGINPKPPLVNVGFTDELSLALEVDRSHSIPNICEALAPLLVRRMFWAPDNLERTQESP
jgi:hypothetical protein